MKGLEKFMSGIKKIIYKILIIYYKLFNYLILIKENVDFETDFNINGIIYIKNKNKIKIGKNFKCNSGKYKNPIGGDIVCRLVTTKKGNISIGNNVGISNSTIFSNEFIKIGNNVLIGGSCRIWDTDFHSIDSYIRITKDNQINSSPIIIEDNVFIGGGCIILKGVIIGKNSIIGAGSVVTKNIPSNEIWGGNPAKFIKKII